MRRARPLILLCAFALLGVLLAGCGSKTSGSSVAPDKRVETALKKASTITSGNTTIDATIATGGLAGSFKVTGGGPFDTKAKGGPAFDLDLSINIAGTDQKLGFTTIGGKSYVKFGNKTFASGKSGSSSTAVDPSSIERLINSLGGYVSGATKTGSKSVGGQTLEIYSVKVDLKRLAHDQLAGSGKSSPTIPGLGSLKDLAKSFKSADATIGIGSDNLPHQIGINAPITDANGGAAGGIKANLIISDINKPVKIQKPTNVVTDSSAIGALGGMLSGGLNGGQ